MSQVK